MPRSLPLASLLLPLLLLAPLPAAAGGGHAASATPAMHAHGFHVGHFNHFNRFHNFAGTSFFAPWGWSDGNDWEGAPVAAGGGPMVIVLNLATPAPAAPAAARPSITKEAGVTVIRGPGTHH